MTVAVHKQIARRLIALGHSLDSKDRKFVGAIARMDRPSPAQIEWLGRVADRASRIIQREPRHA